MRLWHQDLLTRLPVGQLNGQHRECCALRGNGWGRSHSTVDYVFEYKPCRLFLYHTLVMYEKGRRGHSGTDQMWFKPLFRGYKCDPWDEESFGVRELEFLNKSQIYPEHSVFYLNDCLMNLKEKGFDIEWNRS